MGSCCTTDPSAYMKVKLLHGEDIKGDYEHNFEINAFIKLSYGNIEYQRYESRRSIAAETVNGKCEWNQEFEFDIDGLYSDKCLKITLKDYDLVDTYLELASGIIYFGTHPLNPDSLDENNSENSRIKNKKAYKYFLPMFWHKTVKYKIEMKNKQGKFCGNIFLEITMVNPQEIEENLKPLLEN